MTRTLKAPILLYCADIHLLSATAFALRLNDYNIASVHDVRDATAMVAGEHCPFACGVLIHASHADPTGRLIHLLLRAHASMPLLLIDHVGDLAPVRYIDTVLYGRNTKMVHLLAALQVLADSRGGRASIPFRSPGRAC